MQIYPRPTSNKGLRDIYMDLIQLYLTRSKANIIDHTVQLANHNKSCRCDISLLLCRKITISETKAYNGMLKMNTDTTKAVSNSMAQVSTTGYKISLCYRL